MKALLRALAAARTEFDYALRFEDWDRRRDIFAAIDLFDGAWKDRPAARDVTEPAFDFVHVLLRELNEEADR